MNFDANELYYYLRALLRCNSHWRKLPTRSFHLSDICSFCMFADERDAIQKKTFTKWVNKHLKKVRPLLKLTDSSSDLYWSAVFRELTRLSLLTPLFNWFDFTCILGIGKGAEKSEVHYDYLDKITKSVSRNCFKCVIFLHWHSS